MQIATIKHYAAHIHLKWLLHECPLSIIVVVFGFFLCTMDGEPSLPGTYQDVIGKKTK